ncbi:MAG: PAS domain-containing protein [Methylococcaceae bacterium]
MKLKAARLYNHINSLFFISLLFFVFCVVVTEIAINQCQQNDQHKQLIYTEEISLSIQSTLEASINDTFHLHGLRAYLIATQGKIRPDELNAILANYFPKIGSDQLIRNIGVAPDDQIQYIFPLTGNEKALGLRRTELPKQWTMIERAMQEKQSVLIGPIELVQGVSGLIYNVPVFVAENNYWGSISIVINADKIFSLINEKITQTQVQVALRGRNGTGEKGEVFWGDATLFDGEGVLSTIKIPGGSWQLVVKPAAVDTLPLLIAHLVGLLWAGLLATLLFIGLNASRQRKKNADQFSKIASQVPGILFQYHLRLDGSSCFPFVSDSIRDLYRLNPEDILNDASKLFALIHPDDFDNVIATIQKSAQELLSFTLDHRVLHNDGTIRWLSVNTPPQREGDGSTLWDGFTTDITERKQMEAEREEVHNSLQKITSQVPGIVYQFRLRTDGSFCFPFASEAIRDIYRLSPEDVREDASILFTLIHPDDVDGAIAAMQKSAQELSPFSNEYRVQHKDGTVRWLLANSLPQREADGSTLWYGFTTDITDRKLWEDKLRLSNIALKHISQGVLITNHEQNILWINGAFTSITGYSRTEILGQNCRFMRGPLTDKKTLNNMRLAIKNNTTFSGEILNYRKDGTLFWNELTISPVFDEQGQLTNFISSTRDITDRKQIEYALHESEFLWKFAIEGSGDGVWDWNVQTDQAVYSHLWKEMIGYAEDEILPIKQEWLDRIYPDDQLPIAEVLQAYLDGKTDIYVAEYRLRCKDGSYKWILARGMVVDYTEEGTPLRMIGTHTDISKRKFQELQDKEHLNQLAHVTRLGLMGEMASGIAHEVNQPLTAIATYAQVSLNLIKAESPNLDKLAEVVYKTQQQALRAGQIIRRMREFVKSNTKQVATTDLNELIQDAVGLCLPDLKRSNITLTLQLQSPLPLINVDRIQIEQVIINLIRNSADAFDSCLENQQKEISIDSLLTLNEGIEVRVKDNGSGIAEDQQQQILMPFYTTKTEGMGMGLSICCSIIESHEGHLKFNSKVGKGTTFYFTLPIKKKDSL